MSSAIVAWRRRARVVAQARLWAPVPEASSVLAAPRRSPALFARIVFSDRQPVGDDVVTLPKSRRNPVARGQGGKLPKAAAEERAGGDEEGIGGARVRATCIAPVNATRRAQVQLRRITPSDSFRFIVEHAERP